MRANQSNRRTQTVSSRCNAHLVSFDKLMTAERAHRLKTLGLTQTRARELLLHTGNVATGISINAAIAGPAVIESSSMSNVTLATFAAMSVTAVLIAATARRRERPEMVQGGSGQIKNIHDKQERQSNFTAINEHSSNSEQRQQKYRVPV